MKYNNIIISIIYQKYKNCTNNVAQIEKIYIIIYDSYFYSSEKIYYKVVKKTFFKKFLKKY